MESRSALFPPLIPLAQADLASSHEVVRASPKQAAEMAEAGMAHSANELPLCPPTASSLSFFPSIIPFAQTGLDPQSLCQPTLSSMDMPSPIFDPLADILTDFEFSFTSPSNVGSYWNSM